MADLFSFMSAVLDTRKAEFTLINELAETISYPIPQPVINGLDLQKRKYGYYYGYGKYVWQSTMVMANSMVMDHGYGHNHKIDL